MMNLRVWVNQMINAQLLMSMSIINTRIFKIKYYKKLKGMQKIKLKK